MLQTFSVHSGILQQIVSHDSVTMYLGKEKLVKALIIYIAGGSGNWSNEGCEKIDETNSTVVCACNHLTTFALIMVYLLNCMLYYAMSFLHN